MVLVNVILRQKISYKNATDDVSGYKCVAGDMTWSNPVIYTPGMVSPHLAFAPGASSEIDMLNDVKILKATEACDNQYFEQWYADVPGVNKRINTTILFLNKITTMVVSFRWIALIL